MSTEKAAFIISGGTVCTDFAARFLIKYGYMEKLNKSSGNRTGAAEKNRNVILIAADRGVLSCQQMDLKPDYIVGDFDSSGRQCLKVYEGDPDVEIRDFNPEKDWTDTEIATELAIEKGCQQIFLLGGTGTRLDHVLGNIQVLALARSKGVSMCMVDEHNRITLHDTSFTMKKAEQWGHYVSLLAYGGDVTGLTLRGLHYQVSGFRLGSIGSRGISNEIEADTASIQFESGKLLVIESKD